MNLNELTQEAVAKQMGVLLLENTKLKALLMGAQAEINELKGKIAEMEKQTSDAALAPEAQ